MGKPEAATHQGAKRVSRPTRLAEAEETMTKEQMVLLGAAAKNGVYAVSRAYNSKWGDDLQVLKDLESMGLMELVTLERNPLTNAFVRRARITPRWQSCLGGVHKDNKGLSKRQQVP
jgi:hypothetical protein